MASSLVFGPFDVLDPASPVVLAPGWDRGAPVPTVSQIQSTVLDGSAVTGRAAGNRNITMQLHVRAVDRLTLATITNQVLACVDQETWTLTFTPDGGLPVVYDCYRGSAAVTSDLLSDAQGWQALTVQCQALPYGKSPTPQVLALAGSPVTVDGWDSGSVPTVTFNVTPYVPPYQYGNNAHTTGATLVSNTLVTTPVWQGAKALDIAFKNVAPHAGGFVSVGFAATVARTGMSVAVASTMDRLTFRARVAGPQAVDGIATSYPDHPDAVSWRIVLTGAAGTYSGWSTPQAPGNGSWAAVNVTLDTPVPAGETITAYTLTSPTMLIYNYITGNPDYSVTKHLYLDSMVLLPPSSVDVSSPQGAQLTLTGVVGTARAPINLALAQAAAGNFKSWLVHSPPPDRPNAQQLLPLTTSAPGFGTYTSPQTVRYGGTYSVWVAVGTVGSPGTARNWTVGLNQENPSITSSYGSTSRTVSVTPSANQLVYMFDLDLPFADTPPESLYALLASVSSTNTTDTFLDLLLLDTRGRTVVVDSTAGANANAWIDEADPSSAFGGVWAGASVDRSDAASVAASLVTGQQIIVDPGDCTLLVYSPEGALTATATYYPRWLQEATQ